jgi:predicted ATPase
LRIWASRKIGKQSQISRLRTSTISAIFFYVRLNAQVVGHSNLSFLLVGLSVGLALSAKSDEVNVWLSGEERLKTGYRLEKFQFKEVPVPGRFHQLFERGLDEDDLGELQELYATLSARSEIALRDFEKGIIVAPGDVGVGISQMIPVIVGCLRDQQGILAIEQPELHIHPAIQVGLGDLFIQAVHTSESIVGANKTLLVETHSEHIMLRLLRRIRETTDNELPPGVIGLSSDALSVIYVESADDGVRFLPLRVDRDGEFLDRWPKGFFEERAEELF